MLTGRLPYGAKVAQTRNKSQQQKLVYDSTRNYDPNIPVWVDRTLKRAVHPDPFRRHEALSELVHDLRHPREEYLQAGKMPLIERNPLLFWKSLSFLLTCAIVLLVASRGW